MGWIQVTLVISFDEALCEIRHHCRYSPSYSWKRSHAVICWRFAIRICAARRNIAFEMFRSALVNPISKELVEESKISMLPFFSAPSLKKLSEGAATVGWEPMGPSSLIWTECVLCRWQFVLFRLHWPSSICSIQASRQLDGVHLYEMETWRWGMVTPVRLLIIFQMCETY